MSTRSAFKLSTRDAAVLEIMLLDHAGETFFVEAIRQKLQAADIVPAATIPDSIVTIGSRVVFTIDGNRTRDLRLVQQRHYIPGQNYQTIASFRGIAILGLAEGGQTEVRYPGRTETIEITKVSNQPEYQKHAT